MNIIIKKFRDKTKGEQLFTFHGAYSPLLISVPWFDKKESPANIEMPLLFINKERDTQVIVSEDAYKGHAREVFKKYLSKEIEIINLQNLFDKSFNEIKKLYVRVFSEDIKTWDNEAIEKAMKSATDYLHLLISRTLYIEIFDKQIAHDCALESQKEVIDAVWEQSIQHANFESFDIRRKKQTLEVIKKYGINNEGARQATFIYIDYFLPKSLDEIKKLLTTFVKENKNLEKYNNITKDEYESWTSSLNDKEKIIVEYIQFVMQLRDLRKDPIAWNQSVLATLAFEMLRRANIDNKIAYAVSPLEYKNGIEWLKENKEKLLVRTNGITIFIHNNDIETESIDPILLEEDISGLFPTTESVGEIKGQVASKGKCTGNIRIIIDPEGVEVKKFKEGDILVTSMTRPEFVPFMKKAGAIITNEGGITCHAAIISRELGKPCIIGTKIATKVFKDGDEVEVDADNGTVKIIKKV